MRLAAACDRQTPPLVAGPVPSQLLYSCVVQRAHVNASISENAQ